MPSRDPLDALPAERAEAARAALAAAFTSTDTVTLLAGGASPASLFRVDVGTRRYLLRVEGPPSPLRVPTQYEAMRIAAEAGFAPALHHVDAAAGIVVMDFIAQRPISAYPGGTRALAQTIGTMLRRLQATPAFPYFVDYPDMVARLFAHVRRTGLFAPGVLDPHWDRLEQIREAWNRDRARLVSSHNDCHLGNFLFDGEKLWLVDWESAYRNDPLVDVAILLDNLARSPELEDVFLRAYLGRSPDAAIRTQLVTARALTRLYFAGFFLSASAAAGWRATPDTDLSIQTSDGDSQPERMHRKGKMYLDGFLTGRPVPPLV